MEEQRLQHTFSFAALHASTKHSPLCQLFRDEIAKVKAEEKGDDRVTIAGLKKLSVVKGVEIECQGWIARLGVYFEEGQEPQACEYLIISSSVSTYTLSLLNLPMHKRLYSFSTPSDLSKHLSNFKEGQPITRNLCCMSLQYKMHLQSYAMKIHRAVSWRLVDP